MRPSSSGRSDRARRTVLALLVAAATFGCADGQGSNSPASAPDDASEPASPSGAKGPAATDSGASAADEFGAVGGRDEASSAERATGVILLVVDTLRADRLSAYGYERPTASIDRLANEGTLYLDNRSQGSWTRPSMQSMLSGLYVGEEFDAPRSTVPLLSEVLSEAGVETAAFVANPVLGRHAGFDRGYDHFELYPLGQARGGVVLRAFASWYEAREDPGRPWFAWLHMMDPHHPYAPLPQDDLYTATGTRLHEPALRQRWSSGWDELKNLDPDHGGAATLAEASAEFIADSNRYDGEVRATDRFVGSLIEQLREYGVLDDTLIVFASDHGEMLWEYRDYPRNVEYTLKKVGGLPNGLSHLFTVGHTGWFYDQVWRTPLIVRGPGFTAGARLEGLSANVDIHPTVLRALDVDPAGPLDGIALQGSRAPTREQVYGYGREITSVVDTRGWHLVEHGVARFGEGRPTRELLRPQPANELPRNLADKYPPQVVRLEELIGTWRGELRFEGTTETSDASREILEALGYAVPGDEDSEDGGSAGGDAPIDAPQEGADTPQDANGSSAGGGR
ncbi:Arylsulfatase [Planctomycetes bacterium Pla163]|uniref:Arylsulfatase n=1 Tax=Rohdeia mirabilis TaxID=2528008 RepID=A0A518CZ74_9BACT|nr:Arylsulfatase [Planctomycetes bacterium Pla163]